MPPGKKRNFKSKDAYRRWLDFKHIHLPRSKNDEAITIRGRRHKVKHGGK